MRYIKLFEEIDFDDFDWEEEEPNSLLDLYNTKIECIITFKSCKKGEFYKIDKIYGDPEGSIRAGEKYMGIEFANYVKVNNILFSFKEDSICPYFKKYFKIIK